MDRMLNVFVDGKTWPKPPSVPLFPPTFRSGLNSYEVNIPAILLAIGYLTTPSHGSGASLSEYWAWVRYLHAVSDDPDLRLSKAFFDLDAHQKTILSDDFGMGVPICWLADKLALGPIADGRYFIDRVAAQVGATTGKPAKRGPGKSPDFVARDSSGVWHVIECKGTQSGSIYRENQLGRSGPLATGAVAQKRTITFPTNYTGQRLACGLMIGVEGGKTASGLKIIDPPGEEDFDVTENELAYADDAISRAAGARALRLAGFGAVSSAMSAPSGLRPDARPRKGRAEESRRGVVEEKTHRAETELDERADRKLFQADHEKYRGREIEVNLPAPLIVGGRIIRSVRIRYGAGVHFLDELRRQPLMEEPMSESRSAKTWEQMIGQTHIESERFSARFRIGTSFVADLALRR